MIKEEILEGITGYVSTEIISIPKNWIYQAMEEYAEKQLTAERERMKVLVEAFEKYVSNIEWHIRVNKPDGESLRQCQIKLDCYKEIVQALSSLNSK